MIVKTLEDVTGTKGEAHGDKWHSMRLLHAEDGMGLEEGNTVEVRGTVGDTVPPGRRGHRTRSVIPPGGEGEHGDDEDRDDAPGNGDA